MPHNACVPKMLHFEWRVQVFHFPPPPWPRVMLPYGFPPAMGTPRRQGLCRHLDFSQLWGTLSSLWGPEKAGFRSPYLFLLTMGTPQGRGLIMYPYSFLPLWGPRGGTRAVATLPHDGDHGVGENRKGRKHLWGKKNTQGHGSGHFLLGHRSKGEEGIYPSLFCLFCGSCNGLCHTTLTCTGKIHSNCHVTYTKLHGGKAW